MDLCAIMANLLDNAIEASIGLVNTDERKIGLAILIVHSMIIIKVKNACDKVSVEQILNGNLKTTKEEKKSHGYGLKIIQSLTEKYGGSFEKKRENDIFLATVVLFDAQ